jgi:hypothetical protein
MAAADFQHICSVTTLYYWEHVQLSAICRPLEYVTNGEIDWGERLMPPFAAAITSNAANNKGSDTATGDVPAVLRHGHNIEFVACIKCISCLF